MQNFDLRVYGLIVNDKQEVLLSDECENGKFFTKFRNVCSILQLGSEDRDCYALLEGAAFD
jgi:hypothetical protein